MSVLMSQVSVSALAAGGTTSVAHGLSFVPRSVVPNRVTPIVVTSVDATYIYLRNDGAVADSVTFTCSYIHSAQCAEAWSISHLWQGSNPAAGNGSISTVADLTALGALSNAALPYGAGCYVISVDDVYWLTATAHTPDALGVIAGADKGYWVGENAGRWDDLMGNPAQGNAAAALTNEVFRDTPLRMLFFRHDQTDSLHFAYQLPHKWDYSTAVHPHLHVIPMVAPSSSPQTVAFKGQYAWGSVNDATVYPESASWTALSGTLSVVTGDAFKHKILELGELTPPAHAQGPSAVLLLYCYRDSGGDDTYTTDKVGGTAAANLALLSADLHYRSEKMGTITEYA